MRVKTILEFDLDQGDGRTVYFGNSKVGDTATQTVYIQVFDSSQPDLSVSGTMVEGETELPLACIAMADLKSTDVIDEAGIYIVISEPLYSLTIEGSGVGVIKAIA